MTDKPKFGDAVNVPLSEMVVRGIGRVDLTEETLLAAMVEIATDKALTIKPTQLRSEAHVYDAPAQYKGEGVDMRIGKTMVAKPRAKYGTATYGSRDPDARRKYLREYMAKRRRLKKLLTEPSVLEKTDAL